MIVTNLPKESNESKLSVNSNNNNNKSKCFRIFSKSKKRKSKRKSTGCQTNSTESISSAIQTLFALNEPPMRPPTDTVILPKDTFLTLLSMKSSDNEFDNLKTFIRDESLINRRNFEELLHQFDHQQRQLRELHNLFDNFMKLTRDILIRQTFGEDDFPDNCNCRKEYHCCTPNGGIYKNTSTSETLITLQGADSVTTKQPFYRRWYQAIVGWYKKSHESVTNPSRAHVTDDVKHKTIDTLCVISTSHGLAA